MCLYGMAKVVRSGTTRGKGVCFPFPLTERGVGVGGMSPGQVSVTDTTLRKEEIAPHGHAGVPFFTQMSNFLSSCTVL